MAALDLGGHWEQAVLAAGHEVPVEGPGLALQGLRVVCPWSLVTLETLLTLDPGLGGGGLGVFEG